MNFDAWVFPAVQHTNAYGCMPVILDLCGATSQYTDILAAPAALAEVVRHVAQGLL